MQDRRRKQIQEPVKIERRRDGTTDRKGVRESREASKRDSTSGRKIKGVVEQKADAWCGCSDMNASRQQEARWKLELRRHERGQHVTTVIVNKKMMIKQVPCNHLVSARDSGEERISVDGSQQIATRS